MERAERTLAFVVGLDLGQASDYTALVVNERVKIVTAETPALMVAGARGPELRPHTETAHYEHHVRHIQRFSLQTDYRVIVAGVGEIVSRLAQLGPVWLVIDHTGVGRPVVDMFRAAGYGVSMSAVTITGGQDSHRDPDRPWMWTVPKKDLVGALQSQFHQELIKIARTLPEAPTLIRELQTFQMKLTSNANLTFAAWREGDHDDLVLAAALAVWGGMRLTRGGGLA